MTIRLVMVGKNTRGPVQDAFDEYVQRLGRMATLEQVVVPEAGRGDPAYQQRTEGERLLNVLKAGDRVVALDERGKALTSVGFANQLGKWRDQGVRQVVFIVGGPYGLSDAVRERADLVLALSAMTFPHQLVRLIFAEQLYRAFSILQGSPYHH